jgi:transposase
LTQPRHALSDDHYAVIEPLLPTNDRPGHPWKCHRSVINGILWVLHTGAPWRDVPGRYGPWQTVYDRFNRWRKDGTWAEVLTHLLDHLERHGRLGRHLWFVDATIIRGTRAAGGAGKKSGRGAHPGRAEGGAIVRAV